MDRKSVELLSIKGPGRAWKPMHAALIDVFARLGIPYRLTTNYSGRSHWLIVFGVGYPPHSIARHTHLRAGGRVMIWDLGYFGQRNLELRLSINSDHPQQWLDRTPLEHTRWERHATELRDDYDPSGPIILVGLGRKSRIYLNAPNWERDQLAKLRAEFPARRIIHRPKPDNRGHDFPVLDCEVDVDSKIDKLLKGASLVVCRHSNVGVDAAIAGVPFRTEDGAAAWLDGKPYTPQTRLEFLRRLSWWQWHPSEAEKAWEHTQRVCA